MGQKEVYDFLAKQPQRLFTAKEVSMGLKQHLNLIRSLLRKMEISGKIFSHPQGNIKVYSIPKKDTLWNDIMTEIDKKQAEHRYINRTDTILLLILKEIRRQNGNKTI